MKLFNKNEMRKILLIDAHPDSDRLTSSLVDAYKRGALQSGYDVRTIICLLYTSDAADDS